MKTSPSLWKELTDFLNQLGGAVLIKERAKIKEELEEKFNRVGELSEEEKKMLKNCQQRNPIPRLFPTSYTDGNDPNHARLYPFNDLQTKTGWVGLQREFKEVILDKFNNLWLPHNYRMVTLDLSACHSVIFVGLAGPRVAPTATRALNSGNFWKFFMEAASQSGVNVQKEYLKRVFYKALNGGSVKTQDSIANTLLGYYSSELTRDQAFSIGKDIRKLPIIHEIERFQTILASRRQVYLAFSQEPYLGKFHPVPQSKDKKARPPRSSFHGGLMSSRVLVTAEQVLIYLLYDQLLKSGCIPLCLEHDGLIVLTNSLNTLQKSRELIKKFSKILLGVEIDLESKV